ncbi:MAG: hypothetical protein IJP10_04980 [Clostridia bacterium]|nr:hypothetical protein [Clostridia bacterium]
MKRFVFAVLIVCICLSLSGCSHEHTFDTWSASPESHWHVCTECGERSDEGKHDIGEEYMCAVCGSGVYSAGDYGASVYTYDEHGYMSLQENYDAEGNVCYARRYENEYYNDGKIKSVKEYNVHIESGDEVIAAESEFLRRENSENGDVYLSESITYEADGSKTCVTWGEHSYALSSVSYDANGNAVSSERYEYEFDAEGGVTRIHYNQNGEIVSKTRYDASGDEIG